MKKGKWNYTEDITYRVFLVKLLENKITPMSWQNAFVDEERQVVEITGRDNYIFYIDNADGSGLKKIANGGGPDSYSAHLERGSFSIFRELPENDWQFFDKEKHQHYRTIVNDWQKEHFPEDFKKVQSLLAMIEKNRLAKNN